MGDTKAVVNYVKELERNLRAGNATEPSHYPALKTFLEALAGGITATVNPKRIECGAPDFVVSRRTGHGLLTIGYVEAKDVGVSLDEAERSDQLRRYLTLPNLILTDYLEFRWYVEGERRPTARLADVGKGGKLTIEKGGVDSVVDLLGSFLQHAPQSVASPKELALRMARLTHFIRDITVEAFDKNHASDTLRDLHRAFEQTLIPNLGVAQFADMFAQTLAYGLFAARVNHDEAHGRFRRVGAAAEIPKTNPFLRRLFATITGPDLEEEPFAGFVDDLEQLLVNSDMSAVLADFGKRTRKEDPIVHFYETFLAAYDAKLRKVRGVYFTPEPVVSYIVRSVDDVLKTRFNCPRGLADTGTAKYTRMGERGRRYDEMGPRVLILDPVCGTGTFLYAVVDHIRDTFIQQDNAGMWPGYVEKHLLPRLFGFELLMAPYAVAHLKLGMQLAAQDMSEAERGDWAYDFAGDERLGIYLTNTLEEARKKSELLFATWIADEANAAADVKRDLPIMAVLGNPPYAGLSANASYRSEKELVREVVRRGKKIRLRKPREVVRQVPTFIGRLLQDYYQVDGQPLGEKKVWLQDDYVKFIRFGQWRIERTGAGVLAFITNHGYLDNPTFRGMRQQLMNAFTDIYILDLHGNERKKERAPDGGPDKNVFDIQQGVAIGIFVKEPDIDGPARVHYGEMWGTRGAKYAKLLADDVASTNWQTLTPSSPFYLFVPRQEDIRAEYERGWKVTDAFPVSSAGIITARDHFVLDLDETTLLRRIADFASDSHTEDEIRRLYFSGKGSRKYPAGDSRGWKLAQAREEVRADKRWRQRGVSCMYRPFDLRLLYYVPWMVDWPRPEIMQHMLAGENMALATTRSVEIERGYEHVFCTRNLIQHHTVSLKEVNYLFPLYLYPAGRDKPHMQKQMRGLSPWPEGKDGRRPNLSPDLITELQQRLGLIFVPDGKGDLAGTFGPEDVLHYMYAVLHSPPYRDRYAESLKTDFPRVPLTSDLKLFRALAARGAELVSLHLLESPAVARPITHYPVPGSNIVEPGHPRYVAPGEPEPGTGEPLKAGRVYIGEDHPKTGKRGQYFEGVPPEVWDFHVGGYQVCEKWLKDRRGRELSHDGLTHYQRIVVALKETIRLMGEIDAAIPSWPIE